MTQVLDLPVYSESDESGSFGVVCPALPGCYSHGKTLREAEANIRECIEPCLDKVDARGGLGRSSHAHVAQGGLTAWRLYRPDSYSQAVRTTDGRIRSNRPHPLGARGRLAPSIDLQITTN